MKKKYSLACLLLMLFFSFSTASAAPSALVVALLEVRNDGDGGILFVFQVNEKLSKADLNNGFVQVQGGDSYRLHCNQTDDTVVQCSVSKKVSGKNVVVAFAGVKFWVYVPIPKPVMRCYDVYDWDDSFFPTGWVKYGEYCQDIPPNDGDEIVWVNPYLLPPYVYKYSSASQPSWCPSWSGLGAGYYYYYCLD